MTERTPIQISGNRVLCADGTLWKWCDGNVVSWNTDFNLNSNSVGYYSIDRDIRFNMTKKPNFVVRFCMDKLLGFKIG